MNKLDNSLTKNTGLKHYLKNHAGTIICLILLTVIVSTITYYRLLIQIQIGPISDSLVFLSNALFLAGHGTGYYDLMFPPFLSFITSLFFRLGYVSPTTIFALDGILFIFGVVGMFFLLKTRFNNLESFLGGLLFATFPIVLIILGLGFSDLISVSFTIWAFYSLILAVKNDSKFFYLAFPFAMLAFLSRYNSALIIFPIFLYILINKDRINFKNLIIGIGASLLVIAPVLIFFYQQFGSIIYPFLNFGSTSTMVTVSTQNTDYQPNLLFYIQHFTSYVGIQGVIILIIASLGVLVYLLLKFIRKILYKKNIINGLNSENRAFKYKLIILTILLVIFVGIFGRTIYMANEALFFMIAYLFYDITKNLNHKYTDLHIMMFAWFMAFFIFHSIYVIKDSRYFVLMAPPVAYFMILALSEISNKIRYLIGERNVVFPILAVGLTFIILLSTASLLPQILQANNGSLTLNEQIDSASQWFGSFDPDYKDQNIYSELSPNFSWYLKTNVKSVPLFYDNQIFPLGTVNAVTLTQADSNAFNKYLVTNNVNYYLSVRQGLNLTSYKPIKQFGGIIIYQRK